MNDRRDVLKGLAAAGGSALLPGVLRVASPPPLPDYPFRLGVASGYPTGHSVVLWTRLAPQPEQPGGGMAPQDRKVGYEVAADEAFRHIVARGEATAESLFAHSVHQQVAGLAPARDYWYRFTAGDHRSPIGRTRTLPAPRDELATLRLAAACCQNYEHASYAALRHMAADAPDLILYLGDYIYEGAPTTSHLRRHSGGRCITLEDYRQRYAQYQLDPALQAAHLAAPWFAIWDDHEVQNDYAGDLPNLQEDVPGFAARRAAAYQAWYEHLPAPPSMAPRHGGMRIYWRAQLGRLATLHLLDQRQYRSPEACPRPPLLAGLRVKPDCSERLDPARTMLGTAQEQWLADGLRQPGAAWTLIAQGTPFGHMNEGTAAQPEYWTDGWTGYPAARQRLLDSIREAGARNPVILGGDIHAFVVGGVNQVPERLDTPLLAAEFVTTSISSDSVGQATLDKWRAASPQLQCLDGRRRGYLALTLAPERLRADLVTVDDAARADSARSSAGSYIVEAGNPAILPA